MPVIVTREQFDQEVRRLLSRDLPDHVRSQEFLMLAAGYRMSLLKDVLVDHYRTVPAGPFAGMRVIERVSDGCFIPKLMGSYETPLHPHIERACTAGYDVVVNIGCAEGYYAVGFARRMPSTPVHAFDIDPGARDCCREMAVLNGVDGSITIGAAFDGRMFDGYAGKRVLVFCDIEGAEVELLDPARFPALRGMDIIAELHDTPQGKTWNAIPARFSGTHRVTVATGRDRRLAVPTELGALRELDQLLLLWEARSSPTPWAVMTVDPSASPPP
jgi:hypothetical protein